MKDKDKVKIGLLGAGHLGKIHLKLLKEIEGYEVVGLYDPDQPQSRSGSRRIWRAGYLTLRARPDRPMRRHRHRHSHHYAL
jgi:predicted homoserine dehydrogenase-like protein